jgi:hypothetical protein
LLILEIILRFFWEMEHMELLLEGELALNEQCSILPELGLRIRDPNSFT